MAYGVVKDWFGLSSAVLPIQSSDDSASFATDASSEDSNGDVACRTKAGTTIEKSVTYSMIGGGDTTSNSINVDAVAEIGQVFSFDTNTHIQCTGIDISTAGSAFPTITIKGVKDPGDTVGMHATYSTALTVKPIKKAQGFGVTASNGSITAGSVSISGSMVDVADSLGEFLKREPHAVQVKGTHTLQACTGTAAGAADTGFALDKPADEGSQSSTSYGTVTVDVYKDIAQD